MFSTLQEASRMFCCVTSSFTLHGHLNHIDINVHTNIDVTSSHRHYMSDRQIIIAESTSHHLTIASSHRNIVIYVISSRRHLRHVVTWSTISHRNIAPMAHRYIVICVTSRHRFLELSVTPSHRYPSHAVTPLQRYI